MKRERVTFKANNGSVSFLIRRGPKENTWWNEQTRKSSGKFGRKR